VFTSNIMMNAIKKYIPDEPKKNLTIVRIPIRRLYLTNAYLFGHKANISNTRKAK